MALPVQMMQERENQGCQPAKTLLFLFQLRVLCQELHDIGSMQRYIMLFSLAISNNNRLLNQVNHRV